MMTPQEIEKVADEIIVLIDRSTMAIRAGKPAVAMELMRQAVAAAETLPKKEASDD